MDAKWVILIVLSLFHIDSHAAILDLMEDSLYVRAEVKFKNPDFGLRDVYEGGLLQEAWSQGDASYYTYEVSASGTKYHVPDQGVYEYHSSVNHIQRDYTRDSFSASNDYILGRYAPLMDNRYLDGWAEIETDLQWIFQITGDDSHFFGDWTYIDFPGNMTLYDLTSQTLVGSIASAPNKSLSRNLEDGHRYLLDIDTYVSGQDSNYRIWKFGFSNTGINVAEPSTLALMILGSLPLVLFNFRSAYSEST